MKQAVGFLIYAKSRGVNWSDIKPDNIVIKNNRIKFIDFDIAIDSNPLNPTKNSQTSAIYAGYTSGYVSP